MKIRKGIKLQDPDELRKSESSFSIKSNKDKKRENNNDNFADRIKICSKCQGTGIEPSRTYRKCSQCNGKCYEMSKN